MRTEEQASFPRRGCLVASWLKRRGNNDLGTGRRERCRKRRSKRQCRGASASAPAPTGGHFWGFVTPGVFDVSGLKSLLSQSLAPRSKTTRQAPGHLERSLLVDKHRAVVPRSWRGDICEWKTNSCWNRRCGHEGKLGEGVARSCNQRPVRREAGGCGNAQRAECTASG